MNLVKKVPTVLHNLSFDIKSGELGRSVGVGECLYIFLICHDSEHPFDKLVERLAANSYIGNRYVVEGSGDKAAMKWQKTRSHSFSSRENFSL